jgi:hypothetical protein
MTRTQIFYRKRKALGLCIRCDTEGHMKDNGERSPLCYAHYREKQSTKPRTVRETDCLPGEEQAPRGPYRAEYLQNLPELPHDCPRCHAMLLDDWLEVEMEYAHAKRCPNCAWCCDRFMWKNKLEGAQA